MGKLLDNKVAREIASVKTSGRHGIKVLLVYANSPMDNLIPVGLSLISACLKKEGHEVKLFDTTFYRTSLETGDDVRIKTLQVYKTDLSKFGIEYKKTNMIDDFQEMVYGYMPDLIGVSCVEPTLGIALDLLNAVREHKALKILGGIGVMFLGDRVIWNDAVDMICIGEGEEAITELANAIRDGIDYSNIKNLWIKKNGSLIKNEIRPLVDLESLPFADWSIYEKKRFFKPMGGKIRIAGSFELVRGCRRMCTYCCNWGINKFYKGSYVRRKSINKIISEIKHAKDNYGIDYVYFCAENFLLEIGDEDFYEFVEAYKDLKLPFWIETGPDTLNAKKLEALKSVGCEGISIGVEHGNEEFRKKSLTGILVITC